MDGLRIDAFKHLFKSEKFEDEPLSETNKLSSIDKKESEYAYNDFDHIHTTNLRETYELLHEWRKLSDDISRRTKSTKLENKLTN